MHEFLVGFGYLAIYFVIAASSAIAIRKLFPVPHEVFRKILHGIVLGSLLVFAFGFSTWWISAAAFLYEKISMSNMFFLVALISLVSIIIEAQIREKEYERKESYSIQQYKEDIKEGFIYLKREKGIRNIYTYMAVTQGVSDGTAVAIQAFFQTQPGLTITMLGFMKSAEMIGRVASGAF